MKFDTISSGSKGNATIVISHGNAILLDFGISKSRIDKALKSYGMGFTSLKGVFITHSHSDHAGHVDKAPKEILYSPTLTLAKLDYTIAPSHLLRPFKPVEVSSFTLTPLPMSHDAKETVGFVVSDGEETLGYVTDTGFILEKDFPYLTNLNYYLFESNYDPSMLFTSKRPEYLIRRISSDRGHLANEDSAYYLSQLIGEKTKEVVLSHLSDECNTPEKAKDTFQNVMMMEKGYIPDCLLKTASDSHETKGGEA